MKLSKEKISYPLFKGSKWDTGAYFEQKGYESAEWLTLKNEVKEHGIRNGYVFFLQAEDGIRVGHVTGVQTCALPISGVVRVVQGGAHVVAHAAVDGDIDAVVGPAEVDVLDRAHRVQGVGGGAGDRSSGLEGQVRNGQLELLALHRDDPGDPLGQHLRRGRSVLGVVHDAEAAAQVQRVDGVVELAADLGHQAQHPPSGDVEAADVEDLRADMGMQTDQPHGPGPSQHLPDRDEGVPGGQRSEERRVGKEWGAGGWPT